MKEFINPQFKNVEAKKSHYKSRSPELVVRDLRDHGKSRLHCTVKSKGQSMPGEDFFSSFAKDCSES